eukprot:COSAG02_NODE_421_length_22605_cov_158.841198_17_plen_1221_part_00
MPKKGKQQQGGKGKQKQQQQQQQQQGKGKQKGKQQQKQQKQQQQQQQQQAGKGKGKQQLQQQPGKGRKGKAGGSAGGGSPLDAVGAQLRQLVGSQPETGMLLAQLPGRYKSMFKKDLAAGDYGFPKLKTLVDACTAHVEMREGDNGHEWVFPAAGGNAGGKRAAAAAAEEPKAKKQKKKPEQPTAAPPTTNPPADPEQVKLKFLQGREKKGLPMTAEQRKALAELRAKLGLEAPPPPVVAETAGGAVAASDQSSSAKRKPGVLDRLGIRPTGGDKRARGHTTAADVQAVETAPTTDDVFKAVASASCEGGASATDRAVVLAALRRFAELTQDPKLGVSDYETMRGAIVYNKAFHLLLGSLGAAVVGASSSELADVFFALQALSYPRDKEFAEEPLLRKLVDCLLAAHPAAQPYELSVAIWAIAKLRVRHMDHPLLHALCDAVPRDTSLASLDGESVGKLFWSLSARDDVGQKLFGDFQFPKLIRALLGECNGAFETAPIEALMEVASAYPCVGSAFEEDQAGDMKSVSLFLGHLQARAAQLSVDQLLLLLRSVQDFPRSVACPAVGSLLREVSDVITQWSSKEVVSPMQLCRVAAAATLKLLGPVDENGADLLLKTCATLLQPHLRALSAEDLFDLCVTYVLPAVKGERVWAYPIFNFAADSWLGDGGSTVLLDISKDRLQRLGEEFCKCRERPDTVIPSVRDIAAKVAAELHLRDSHLSPELKQFRWMEVARRQDPPPPQSDPRNRGSRDRSPPRSRADQRVLERDSARRGGDDRRARPVGDSRDSRDVRWQTTQDASRRQPEHLDDRRGPQLNMDDRRVRQPTDQQRDPDRDMRDMRDMRDNSRRGQDDPRAGVRPLAASSASSSGWDIAHRGGDSDTRLNRSKWDGRGGGNGSSAPGRDDRRAPPRDEDDARRGWEDAHRDGGGAAQPRYGRDRDRDDVGRDDASRRIDRYGDSGKRSENWSRDGRRDDRTDHSRERRPQSRERDRGDDRSREREREYDRRDDRSLARGRDRIRDRDDAMPSRDRHDRHRRSGSDDGAAGVKRVHGRVDDSSRSGDRRDRGGSGNRNELLLSYLDERVDESTLHNAFQSFGGADGIRFIRLMRDSHEAVVIFGSEDAACAAAAQTVGEFSLGNFNCMVTYMGSKQRPSVPTRQQASTSRPESSAPAANSTESAAGYEYDPKTGYYFHQATGEKHYRVPSSRSVCARARYNLTCISYG